MQTSIYEMAKQMDKPKILIINSCSKSKATSHRDQPTCVDLTTKEGRENQKSKFKNILTPAGQLYTGKQASSIQSAVNIFKEKHEVDYYIISAGFGFVNETEQLPPYECSFSGLGKRKIREMSENLSIVKDMHKSITGKYDLIYLALGIDYLSAVGNLDFLASKTSLLVHYNKHISEKEPYFLVNDYHIVTSISKLPEKIFEKPIGALIASKGTLLENYAISLQENNITIKDKPFNTWLEPKMNKINLVAT